MYLRHCLTQCKDAEERSKNLDTVGYSAATLTSDMGIITWIILAVVVLAIIGLGVGTFASGIFQGAKTVGENPVVQNATGQAKDMVKEKVREGVNDVLK